jgi:hypothetical protein
VAVARRILLWTWSAYGLLWLVIAAMVLLPGAPTESGFGQAIVVILGFAVAQVGTLIALVIGVVLGWRALRKPEHRTWANLGLVGVSILGIAGLSFYAGRFLGVL